MRFLVDENLSPRVAEMLSAAGHDGVHVRELEEAGSPDVVVAGIAAEQGRIIISADTDFGAILAHTRHDHPDVGDPDPP